MTESGLYQKVATGNLEVGLIEDSAVVGSIKQARGFGKALRCHKALHLDAIDRRVLRPTAALDLLRDVA